MTPAHPTATPRHRSRLRMLGAFAFAALLSGCFRGKPGEAIPHLDPVGVHVKNENYLDMNVAVLAGGISRRLGLVPGNSSGDFKIEWSVVNGQTIALTATPIGGRGVGSSGALNVGPGQVIEFRIGSVLRQTTAAVREP